MKRIIAMLLAAIMVISLAACSGSSADTAETKAPSADTVATEAEKTEEPKASDASAGEKKKLVVWLPPQTDGETTDYDFWVENFAPWEEANNCEIDLTIVPWGSYEEKYLTGFSSGEGPDVGYMYNEMLYQYIEMGQLEVLDDYLTDEDRDEYLHLSVGQVDGKQYTMPFFPGGAKVMFYNKDILDEAGVEPPTTWDEFIQAGLTIKEKCPDVVVDAVGWADEGIGCLNFAYYPYMWQAGGTIMDTDGTVTLMDNDGAVKAAQFAYDLMHKYGIMSEDSLGITSSEANTIFESGQAAFHCGSDDHWNRMDPSMNWGFIPQLGMTDGDDWQTWTCADALIMNSSSNEKELAWSLIKYITSPDIMVKVHTDLCPCPTLTKSEPVVGTDMFDEMYTHDDQFHALPVAKNSNAVMANLKANLQLMLLDELTPEEAIQNTVDYSKTLE